MNQNNNGEKEKIVYEAEIIPAVMPTYYGHLKDTVRRVARHVEWVQLDVMDGKYTPSKSWPYMNKGDHFLPIMNGEEGLPFWEEVNYSVDLMTLTPHEEAVRWADAGAGRMILHYASFKNNEVLYETITELQSRGVEIGIAILPGSDVLVLEPFKNVIDEVQCMGIKNIGFQGEPFDESVLQTITEVAKHYPHVRIAVDGSVNPDTIEDLYEAGARRFAVGSYVLDEQAIPQERIDILEEIIDSIK